MDGTPLTRRRLMTGLALAVGLTIGGYAPLGAATASAAPPVGNEPPDPDAAEAAAILASLRLLSFTATPATVLPFKSSTLAWSVRRSGPSASMTGIQFNVAGAAVAASGQKLVTPPLDAQAYQIVAKFNGKSRQLGTRIVTVDSSRCLRLPVSAGQLRSLVKSSLEESLPPDIKARLKNPSVTVTISTAGVHVRVVSEVEVDDFVNPTVTIAMTIGLRTNNGLLEAQLISSDIDVDFPWWVHFVPPIVSEFIQNSITNRIKNQIQSALPALVNQAAAQVASLPPGFGIWTVIPSSQLLTLVICHR